MPDFGIGEALAALGAFGGAEAAGGAGLAAGLGGGAAAGLDLGTLGLAGAGAGAGALGAEALGGAGAGAGLDLSGLATSAGTGAAAGGADALGALTAGGVGAGAGLGLEESGALPAAASPTEALTGSFADRFLGLSNSPLADTLGGGATGAVSPTGAVSSIAPGAASAAGTAAPAGVAASGIDLTSAAAGGVAGGAPGAAGGAGAGGGLDLASLFKTAQPWLGPAAAAGGLGYQVLQGQKLADSTKAIQAAQQKTAAQAQPLIDQGTTYTGYTASGTLPPAQQAQLDQQVHDAKAALISQAAARGENTNLSQNTQLAAAIANVDNQALQMKGTLEQQLAQTGTGLIGAGANLTGLSDTQLAQLSQIDQAQTAAIGKAIANFASALGNVGRPGIKLPTSGTTIQIG